MSLKTSIHTQFLVLLYIDFYTIIISDFGLFVRLKFIIFCQNIQFIVVINKRTHYISHSLLLPHIYLFFIKFMTYFDKSFRKCRIQCYIKTKIKKLRICINTMWHFMPISYVIINTGSKYRLTFSVKNGKKAATWGCLFCVPKLF